MGLLKSRGVTICVALATLIYNTLSSALFHQLPDDPYHLAGHFGWYLHFANILSVFGFVGALREHALSVAIFSNYLIIDTVLCSIPRFLVLTVLQRFSASLCDPASTYLDFSSPSSGSNEQALYPSTSTATQPYYQYAQEWTPTGCRRIVTLFHITLAAGVATATLLQLVGALCVREYAKSLFLKGMLEDGEELEEGLGFVDTHVDGEGRAGLLGYSVEARASEREKFAS